MNNAAPASQRNNSTPLPDLAAATTTEHSTTEQQRRALQCGLYSVEWSGARSRRTVQPGNPLFRDPGEPPSPQLLFSGGKWGHIFSLFTFAPFRRVAAAITGVPSWWWKKKHATVKKYIHININI